MQRNAPGVRAKTLSHHDERKLTRSPQKWAIGDSYSHLVIPFEGQALQTTPPKV